jgi:hypothetical protein
MGQVFHPATNTLARASVFGGALILAALVWFSALYAQSSFLTEAKAPIDQPVPFSHEHHVAGLGIDCRYCHTSVEQSSFAGVPPTETCMTCHSQVWNDAPMLAPVRDSLRTNTPIQWNRIYDLPHFVYFDHSIHVNKGVGCESCHGRVDQMPLTWKAQPLTMSWCLTCHREPERFLRPRDQVFTMGYQPPGDQLAIGRRLKQDYHVDQDRLTNCSTCHR